jgi:hypothetical protein
VGLCDLDLLQNEFEIVFDELNQRHFLRPETQVCAYGQRIRLVGSSTDNITKIDTNSD